MRIIARTLIIGVLAVAGFSVASCGGDSPTASSGGGGVVVAATNVLPVVVDSGPADNSVNTLFTSVTLCVPGSTTQCQTIDHVQVDTGSYGLRVLGSVLTLSLPVTVAADGNSLAECTQFVDGYSWGPVASADVQLSGEKAASVPIQVIGVTSFPAAPAACSSTGTEEDTVTEFGANGVLGIGVFEQDCGTYCAQNAASGYYYSCSQSVCAQIAAPLTVQVTNPVPLFAADNNGTIIDLPTVPSPGAATVTGSLIFGIDTQTNNASGKQTVLTVDPDYGEFTTVFDGATLDASFVDSGTNGLFFNDSNITACSSSDFSGFYCPATSQSFTATMQGANGVTATPAFTVDNAQTEATNNPTYTALTGLAGTYTSATDTFDWGLPFYYGRRVATGIENHTTTVGTGPYIAF
jgi:hypothetical protein